MLEGLVRSPVRGVSSAAQSQTIIVMSEDPAKAFKGVFFNVRDFREPFFLGYGTLCVNIK